MSSRPGNKVRFISTIVISSSELVYSIKGGAVGGASDVQSWAPGTKVIGRYNFPGSSSHVRIIKIEHCILHYMFLLKDLPFRKNDVLEIISQSRVCGYKT